MCLLAPDGVELGCAHVDPLATDPRSKRVKMVGAHGGKAMPAPPPEPGEGEQVEPPSPHDYAALTVEAFHDRAFAMPVGLSNVDLGSLDGTATLSGEAARERMEGLLDDLSSGEKKPQPEPPPKPALREPELR
jgi:hypothetical protein